MGEWKLMSSAPKDGSLLLHYPESLDASMPFSGGIIEGWWHQVYPEPDENVDGWETVIGHVGTPDYWMEVPPLYIEEET